jgi:hypothetical protein
MSMRTENSPLLAACTALERATDALRRLDRDTGTAGDVLRAQRRYDESCLACESCHLQARARLATGPAHARPARVTRAVIVARGAHVRSRRPCCCTCTGIWP